ncbi:hypothetical protein EGR_02102 [Echinococcus granulosus]|uniref:Uncharacterized protein n=1 Tax=Echinococcus granulosus TaxID=6210 RepID=W6UP45_ECHGR|nr:hypothetical protein EGR_02102 [Echinococcus granulosus]EUB63008.1 hypothetical protein EGR_02102 [Echinococcus granulosus]
MFAISYFVQLLVQFEVTGLFVLFSTELLKIGFKLKRNLCHSDHPGHTCSIFLGYLRNKFNLYTIFIVPSHENNDITTIQLLEQGVKSGTVCKTTRSVEEYVLFINPKLFDVVCVQPPFAKWP